MHHFSDDCGHITGAKFTLLGVNDFFEIFFKELTKILFNPKNVYFVHA